MQSSTTEVNVRIEGITPLICNRFTDQAQMDATSGNRSSYVGASQTPQEIAEQKLYRSEHDGAFVIPQPNIFRCLIDAGTFFKVGKSKVTTQKTSLIPACIEMNQVEYPIEHKQDWKVDTRAVVIPSTGGRVLCHRPTFDDWAIDFTIVIDTSMIAKAMVREIVDAAGKRIGLGDFRPARKGPYGKFSVTRWENGE